MTLPASIWACACPCLSSACPVWFILGGGALMTPFWSIWLTNKRNCTIALYTWVTERESGTWGDCTHERTHIVQGRTCVLYCCCWKSFTNVCFILYASVECVFISAALLKFIWWDETSCLITESSVLKHLYISFNCTLLYFIWFDYHMITIRNNHFCFKLFKSQIFCVVLFYVNHHLCVIVWKVVFFFVFFVFFANTHNMGTRYCGHNYQP